MPASPVSAAPSDLVVTGGTVVDPGRGVHTALDVAVRGDAIAAVTHPGAAGSARLLVDATGCLVTPGLIDLHAHIGPQLSTLGLQADEACLPAGVTTVVDAGTTGWRRFPELLEGPVARSRARILAFVNLSAAGIAIDDGREYADPGDVDVAALETVLRRWPGIALGVKVRVQRAIAGNQAVSLLTQALAATESTGTRLMVHVTDPAIPWLGLLDRLRPGDVVTHAFHGKGETVASAGNIEAAAAAQDRGIVLDLGHGAGSFSFEVAAAALAAGVAPDTISTDLHTASRDWPVIDLPTTMSKMIALGMPIDDAIAAVTSRPAAIIGADSGLGTLAPGGPADIALLATEGPVEMGDCHGRRLTAPRLRCVATIRAGVLVHADPGRVRQAPPPAAALLADHATGVSS